MRYIRRIPRFAKSQACWVHISNLTLGRLRQDNGEFEANMGNIVKKKKKKQCVILPPGQVPQKKYFVFKGRVKGFLPGLWREEA